MDGDEIEGDDRPKYGKVVIYDENGVQRGFAEDMPFFVILGQDALGGAAIAAYAMALRDEGFPKLAADARAFLLRFQTWQIEHADQVKLPD
jgi:hypothetical protein